MIFLSPLGIPSDSDIELAFLERFFLQRDLEPYPVQDQAFTHIFAGDSVLVTVPTGTGKTLIAKAALYKAVQSGQKAVYTTPLRALTEEKYRELCQEFGADQVGFATGDFKVNRSAPIQVEVAEILWNRVFGDGHVELDVVVMDEGHYFNDVSRGYVWEQSIIGLDSRVQLIVLSATIGAPDRFCHWASLTRNAPMKLVESRERKVPLHHQYQERYLIETVRDLAHHGEVPSIVFVFGRERCFEVARLLKSCRRFTSDDERDQIAIACDNVLLDGGASGELRALLLHGIGIHHAGILPRYRRLVEDLAAGRLAKFIVCTETISAGINLPAKAVVFPSLSKFVDRKARLLTSAEYHQMAGRAGRPQFDTEGVAITLAPEELVQALRKEVKNAAKTGYTVDETQLRKSVYARLRSESTRKGGIVWDRDSHQKLIEGQPAQLRSQTRIDPGQVLAIGLSGGGREGLDIETVVERLLLPERERAEARGRLKQVADNLLALGVTNERGQQITGEMICELRGMDGLFVYYALTRHKFDYSGYREMVEWLVTHDVIHRFLARKQAEKRKEWIRVRLRQRRQEGSQVSWEDIEQEYEANFPRELTRIEQIHGEFCASLVHPQLHPKSSPKTIWATMEEEQLQFHDFVAREGMAREEGSLFSYLVRVMGTAARLHKVTNIEEFSDLAGRIREVLAEIDPHFSL